MSTEIKKILFPTDLTKHARYAFNVAPVLPPVLERLLPSST
jgi:hypothetical protein